MSKSKHYKRLVEFLKGEGYVLARVNTKGFEMYKHPDHDDIGVNPAIKDTQATHLLRNSQRMIRGRSDKHGRKRKPAQIKERHAEDRKKAAAEIARRKGEVAALLADRDARMGAAGFSGTDAEFRDLLARIDREERELRYWQRLMTEVPGFGNKNKHRS